MPVIDERVQHRAVAGDRNLEIVPVAHPDHERLGVQ